MTRPRFPITPAGHYLKWHDRVDLERRTHLSLFPEPNKWAQFDYQQIQTIAERLAGRQLWLPQEELIKRIEDRERIKKQPEEERRDG